MMQRNTRRRVLNARRGAGLRGLNVNAAGLGAQLAPVGLRLPVRSAPGANRRRNRQLRAAGLNTPANVSPRGNRRRSTGGGGSNKPSRGSGNGAQGGAAGGRTPGIIRRAANRVVSGIQGAARGARSIFGR
jgi:hypothetical protein